MKKSFIYYTIALALLPVYLFGQNCESYFPSEKGTELVISNYDNKDKLTGTTKQKLVEKKDVDGKIEYLVDSKQYDSDETLVFDKQLKMICENGNFQFDMSSYLSGMENYEGMEMEIEGNDLIVPNKLSVGQELPDAQITLRIKSNGVAMMSMTVNINNRKVEAKENVTVPAGTFSCYKISYIIESKMLFVIKTSAIDWIAKDIGMIRQESYNKKVKLSSYSVLSAINN